MAEFTLINPIILKVFLYRNDYSDRLLISELRKMNCIDVQDKSSGSFYIKKDEMAHVVRGVFGRELDVQRALPVDRLSIAASSLFFIDNLIEQYKRLKHFHVIVMEDESFTRVIGDEINFDYKIDLSKIDLSIAIDAQYMHHFKETFLAIGVYDHTQPYYNRAPYFEIFTRDLVQKLDAYAANFPEESVDQINARNILSFFNNKLQQDNSQLLIIMER